MTFTKKGRTTLGILRGAYYVGRTTRGVLRGACYVHFQHICFTHLLYSVDVDVDVAKKRGVLRWAYYVGRTTCGVLRFFRVCFIHVLFAFLIHFPSVFGAIFNDFKHFLNIFKSIFHSFSKHFLTHVLSIA